MKKYNSDFKLPKVHFQTEVDIPQSPPHKMICQDQQPPHTNKLTLMRKYNLTSAKSRGRSYSNLTSLQMSHEESVKSKRKKSKMILNDIAKKEELDKQKRLLGSIEQKYSQQFAEYRKKYYKPENVREALEKILSHKSNVEEISSNLLRERCVSVMENSIYYDPLLEFYKESFGSLVVVDEVFNVNPKNYELAREIFIVQQKLHNLILNHKRQQIDTVSTNINNYSQNIKYLKRKLMMVGGDRVKTEIEKFGKELDRGDVKGLISGYRLEQENIIDRINRKEKSLGKLIKNRLLLSQAEMITKRHQFLKQRSIKTEI